MKLAALQKLYIAINGKPRGSVPSAVQMVAEINNKLAEIHAIQESQSLRDSVTRTTFDRLSKIEEIQGKSQESVCLSKVWVRRKSEVQSLKQTLQEEKTRRGQENDVVKDLIGG